jgi:hypothetical protein
MPEASRNQKGFMKGVGSRRRTQNTYEGNENEDEVHPGLRGRSPDLQGKIKSVYYSYLLNNSLPLKQIATPISQLKRR